MKRKIIKMASYKIFLFLAVLFLVTYWGLDRGNTEMHEAVHEKIYKTYNISSVVKINNPIETYITGIGGTTSVEAKEYYTKCNETCRDLHATNDMIGYNVASIYQSIFVVGFLICITIMLLSMKKGGETPQFPASNVQLLQQLKENGIDLEYNYPTQNRNSKSIHVLNKKEEKVKNV